MQLCIVSCVRARCSLCERSSLASRTWSWIKPGRRRPNYWEPTCHMRTFCPAWCQPVCASFCLLLSATYDFSVAAPNMMRTCVLSVAAILAVGKCFAFTVTTPVAHRVLCPTQVDCLCTVIFVYNTYGTVSQSRVWAIWVRPPAHVRIVHIDCLPVGRAFLQ